MRAANRENSDEGLAELAPLTRFDPEAFLKTADRDVAAVIITLALVYNDLHTLVGLAIGLMKTAPVDRDTPTTALGEYNGNVVYLQRLMAGWLEETLYALKKNEEILERPEFVRCVRRLRGPARAAWAELLRLAECAHVPPRANRSLRRALQRVRGNVGFHYYQCRAAIDGFEESFRTLRRPAYVSLGDSLPGSRFYFADAAAQGAVSLALTANGVTLDDIMEPLGSVSRAVRYIVEAYLSNRGLLPTPAR